VAVKFSSPERQSIVQLAYHVGDLDGAMERWRRTMGIGPFLVRRHIALDKVLYRGAASTLDISAAHAQSGDIQIELIQQHCSAPSAFRDMFAEGEEGLHHVALFPEDHQEMVAHYNRLGYATATDLITAEKRGAAYVDTRSMLGHMVEIYRVNDSLIQFYEAIAKASDGWDGERLAIEV
jgi:hypothetical protein